MVVTFHTVNAFKTLNSTNVGISDMPNSASRNVFRIMKLFMTWKNKLAIYCALLIHVTVVTYKSGETEITNFIVRYFTQYHQIEMYFVPAAKNTESAFHQWWKNLNHLRGPSFIHYFKSNVTVVTCMFINFGRKNNLIKLKG